MPTLIFELKPQQGNPSVNRDSPRQTADSDTKTQGLFWIDRREAKADQAELREALQQQHTEAQTRMEQQLQVALATQREQQEQIDALREQLRSEAAKGPLADVLSEEQLAQLQARLT